MHEYCVSHALVALRRRTDVFVIQQAVQLSKNLHWLEYKFFLITQKQLKGAAFTPLSELSR